MAVHDRPLVTVLSPLEEECTPPTVPDKKMLHVAREVQLGKVTAIVVVTGDGATREAWICTLARMKKYLSMKEGPVQRPPYFLSCRAVWYKNRPSAGGIGCEASMSPKGGLATFDSISATMLV